MSDDFPEEKTQIAYLQPRDTQVAAPPAVPQCEEPRRRGQGVSVVPGPQVLSPGIIPNQSSVFDEDAGRALVRNLLRFMGRDPDSDALHDTPRRVVDAWKEMLSGYSVDPGSILSVVFQAQCDEMVTLSRIPFYSTCEHHLLPFSGEATVSYLPNVHGRVVGISKIARLVECFARRLQLQERMTGQIADAMMEHLLPRGAGVVIEASHLCMVCRGVQKPGAIMRTTALRGDYKNATVRSEFLAGL